MPVAGAAGAETGGVRVVSAAPLQSRLEHLGRLAERDTVEARRLLQQEAALFDAAPYPTHMAYLRLLRRTHLDAGQLRAAYAVDERLIALATAMDDHRALALTSLGRVHRHLNENDPAAAMALLESLAGPHRAAGGVEFEAGADLAYGAIYHLMGQHDRALGHYLHCLELLQRHPTLWSPREADVRLALARLYVNNGNAAKALETTRDYRAARLSAKAAGGAAMSPRTEAQLDYMDGRAHVNLKQMEQAHAAFERALALARRHGLRTLQAYVLGTIADARLKQHDYIQAELAARAAIPIAEDVAERGAAQIAYANLGLALFGQGRTAEGVSYIDRTAEELRKGGAMPMVAMLLEEKAAALEKAGQYRQALQAMRERELLRDALASERRNKAFAALQEQFNAKQRAAQIERLRHENAAKDAEIENRKLRTGLASLGAVLAGVLAVVVSVLYRKSQATSRRLAQLNAELAYRSARDPLTGLYNRRSFAERMRERPGQDQDQDQGALSGDCFILLDIDHFKRINDRHGHAAGDAVLVEVGRRLNEAVRETDMVLRWGGEEFLVHSQGVTPAQRPQLVQRILNAIAAAPVVLADGSLLAISATAGAVALPLASSSVSGWEGAIALADRALYKGKEAGRNRGFIVEDVAPAGAGMDTGLRLQLVLPDMAWKAA